MHFRPRKAHGISRGAAHATRQPVPPRQSRRRRLARFALRLGIFLVLLLGVILLALFFRPWSSPWLDRRVQEQWRKTTGLPLSYESATFRLSHGTVEILRPAVLNPGDGRILLDARRIRIHVPIGQFFFSRPPYAIRSIDVDSSLTLPVILKDDKTSFGPDWDRVISVVNERLRERRLERQLAHENRATTPSLALHDLRINSAEIRLSRERAGQPAQPLFHVESARLNASFDGTAIPRLVRVDGRLNEKGATRDLNLVLRPDPARQQADLNLRLAGFDSLRDVPWHLPFNFGAAAVDLIVRVGRPAPARVTLNGASRLSGFSLAGVGELPEQQLGDGEAHFNLALDQAAGRLDVIAASLASKVCSVQTSGTMLLRDHYPYTLHVNPLQAQGQSLAMIADALGRGGEVVRPGGASLGLRATVHGSLRQRLPDEVFGRLDLAGLSINSPDLPPMENMQLAAVMTTGTLTIESARALVQGMPMAFSGTIHGRPLRGQVKSADVKWKADGDLVSVATLIQSGTSPQGPSAGLQMSGKVSGQGRIFVPEPLKGKIVSVIERTRVEGHIDLKDVTVRHPTLLEPIRKASGRFDLVENTARLTRASGEWMGASVTLSGQLKGRPLVWNKPHLTLNGSAGFDIKQTRARLAEASPEMKERMAAWPPLAGRADLNLNLETDLRRGAEADYAVRLALHDFATELKAKHFGGPLNLRQAQLTLEPGRLELDHAAGRWGELAVDCRGELTPAGGALRLTGGGELAEVGRRVPIVQAKFRVGGAADLDSSFSLAARPGFTPPATWQGLREALRDEPRPVDWRRWFARRYVLDGGGRIDAHDAEWTFYAMPARLWGINGPLRFDMRRLWTPGPLPVRGGERSQGCRGTLELVYGTTLNDLLLGNPRKTLLLNYRITEGHVATDEWLQDWKFRRPPVTTSSVPRTTPLPYTPDAPVNMRMHGELSTPSAAYRGVLIRNFRCVLDLDLTGREYSNYFSWHDIAGRVGQGDFMAEGHMVSGEVVTNANATAIELAPLIKGLTGKDNVSGIFSGKLSGSLALRRGFGYPDNPPLEGSGKFRIVESRFVSNKIFNSMFGLLNLPVIEDLTFSTIEGPFAFKGQRFTTRGVTFDNPTVLHLNVVGAYGPQKALDMDVQLQMLPKAIERIPLLGQALDLFNKVVGKVFRFKLRGTPDNPEIRML